MCCFNLAATRSLTMSGRRLRSPDYLVCIFALRAASSLVCLLRLSGVLKGEHDFFDALSWRLDGAITHTATKLGDAT